MGAVTPAAADDAVRAAIADAGWCTVSHLFEPDEVERARGRLDEVLDAEADVAADRGWRTEVHHVAYALPVKHRDLLDLALHPNVIRLARSVLGDDCVLAAANGIDLPADSPGQVLHRDHPVPTPGTTLYLHVVCALDDFRPETGAAVVIPGSHRSPLAELTPGEVAASSEATVAEVAAGGAVVYDGCLVHGAGPNPAGARRRALHLFFARPWVQPHWDFPATFGETASGLDDDQRLLLGFGPGPRRFDLAERRVHR